MAETSKYLTAHAPPAKSFGNISTPYTAVTTANEVVADLKSMIGGKTILITGPSPSSLGSECALSLAVASPARIILAARTPSRLAATAAAIGSVNKQVPIETLQVDLGSLKSVRKTATEITEHIDVLINSAAIMANDFRQTEDGFESMFGTNHLGHFLFTALLWKRGILGPKSRIVNISSEGHWYGSVRFEDLDFDDGKKYDKWLAYGQSKSANVLFSVGLAKRGILSYSVHPGPVKTNIANEVPVDEVEKRVGLGWRSLQQGAATYVVAGFDPRIVADNGAYLEDGHVSTAAEWATDPEKAERLWRISEELVGEKFEN